MHTANGAIKVRTIADTGASDHFFEFAHTDLPIINVRPTTDGISVLIPNGDHMLSTHTAELDLPHLPHQAKQVHLFPSLASGSLLSIGKLCDAGCYAVFVKQNMYI